MKFFGLSFLSISYKTKLDPLFSTAPYKIQQTQARFETVQIASLINIRTRLSRH